MYFLLDNTEKIAIMRVSRAEKKTMQTTKIYTNSQSEQERRAQEYANQLLRERNAKLETLAAQYRKNLILKGVVK